MQPITLKELEWIHDCDTSSIVYASADTPRLVKIALSCPVDLGYMPWQGKKLLLTAVDVAVMSHFVWGWITGPDAITAIRPGISNPVRESITKVMRMGAQFPGTEFTVSFRSGSSLEILCQSLQLEVLG